ncbi:hypothetical protein [Jiangella rhizosphaerae]|uniref:hypothetical protein n=1 Tax=Jiangella rhizosphaerae TaxID=2293569 RepID=UPI001314F0EC|nr:hypothetical protein [Jiangella rhizosphaerae]
MIITGEAAGRFAVAIAQAAVIITGTSLFFGVNWGDPVGAAALIIAGYDTATRR